MTNVLARINEKNIFLVDGIGAFLSAFSLGVTLPFFRDWIGMPVATLYFLAAIAFIYSIYSVSRYYFSDCRNSVWLKVIIFANLSYCALTAFLVIAHLQPS